jgi:sigma-B regulation protein RsbU (phosphoserine phosphatase)
MKKAGKAKNKASMATAVIGVIVLLLAIFGIVVSAIGYFTFSNSMKMEYETTTYHIADTAAQLINGDHIQDYLDGREMEEYRNTKTLLDGYCRKINVSLVYVIQVDRSDYGRFVSVFNSINNGLDNSNYTEWELGYRRDTTNDEYRAKYKALYEQTTFHETIYRMNPTDGSHPHITTMVPIKDMYNLTTCILCIQRPASEIRNVTRPYLIIVAASTLLLMLLVVSFLASYMRRQFVRPIRKVAGEAVRFAKDNEKGEPLEGISKLREIDDLAVSIDTMETDMVRYIEEMTTATAEKERMGTELSLASTIQENSLPNSFPAFPDRDEFDIYAVMDPARQVGGDFYNFFLIDEDHLGLVIGDVSGKGVPAALFMMVSNILVTITTERGGTPAEILSFVNDRLCWHNTAEMFVTIWLGILEISTGRIIAANAGHEYPAVESDGKFSILKDPHGFVAGGMSGIKYKDYEIRLNPGDKLFLYTDGVPEATDTENRLFGVDRMLDALNEEPEAGPEKLLGNIRKAVDGFVKEAEQFDDLTMLCLEYRGKESMKAENELEIEAVRENLPEVLAFVDQKLEGTECSPKAAMQIDIAVEEIFVNIADYAYKPDTGKAVVRTEVSEDPVTVTITFIDGGVPYDPTAKEDPDVSLSAEERQIGGLGIFMTKKSMDEISYEYKDGKNILTLKKHL